MLRLAEQVNEARKAKGAQETGDKSISPADIELAKSVTPYKSKAKEVVGRAISVLEEREKAIFFSVLSKRHKGVIVGANHQDGAKGGSTGGTQSLQGPNQLLDSLIDNCGDTDELFLELQTILSRMRTLGELNKERFEAVFDIITRVREAVDEPDKLIQLVKLLPERAQARYVQGEDASRGRLYSSDSQSNEQVQPDQDVMYRKIARSCCKVVGVSEVNAILNRHGKGLKNVYTGRLEGYLIVNNELFSALAEHLKEHVTKGVPFESEDWVRRIVALVPEAQTTGMTKSEELREKVRRAGDVAFLTEDINQLIKWRIGHKEVGDQPAEDVTQLKNGYESDSLMLVDPESGGIHQIEDSRLSGVDEAANVSTVLNPDLKKKVKEKLQGVIAPLTEEEKRTASSALGGAGKSKSSAAGDESDVKELGQLLDSYVDKVHDLRGVLCALRSVFKNMVNNKQLDNEKADVILEKLKEIENPAVAPLTEKEKSIESSAPGEAEKSKSSAAGDVLDVQELDKSDVLMPVIPEKVGIHQTEDSHLSEVDEASNVSTDLNNDLKNKVKEELRSVIALLTGKEKRIAYIALGGAEESKSSAAGDEPDEQELGQLLDRYVDESQRLSGVLFAVRTVFKKMGASEQLDKEKADIISKKLKEMEDPNVMMAWFSGRGNLPADREQMDRFRQNLVLQNDPQGGRKIKRIALKEPSSLDTKGRRKIREAYEEIAKLIFSFAQRRGKVVDLSTHDSDPFSMQNTASLRLSEGSNSVRDVGKLTNHLMNKAAVGKAIGCEEWRKSCSAHVPLEDLEEFDEEVKKILVESRLPLEMVVIE